MVISSKDIFVLIRYEGLKEFLDLKNGNLYLWYDRCDSISQIELSESKLVYDYFYQIRCSSIREYLIKYLKSEISILELLNIALKFNYVSMVQEIELNTNVNYDDFNYEIVIDELQTSSVFNSLKLPGDIFLGFSVDKKIISAIQNLIIPEKIINKFPNIKKDV